ncbi:MAG: family 43 glycosylhydrolase [Prevotella sp.]|nr:family 43 glycosylhydrolase [Prevotella sp.]
MKPFCFGTAIKLFALLICLCHSAVVTAYEGTPFSGTPIPVPGTVEAENFDLGGPEVACHWGNSSPGGTNYRSDITKSFVGVCGDNDPSTFNLGWTSSGDWTNYSINALYDGNYDIQILCSSGSDNGKFDLKIDGEIVCRTQSVPSSGWDTYVSVVVHNVPVKQGARLFTWYTYGGMNVDKFIFVRTGDYTAGGIDGEFNYKYPITQTYDHNPLFVGLPSQMSNTKFTGTLYTADPSAHVWNVNGEDVLYLYPSHDIEPTQGCDRMDRYHVFSTKDMKTWTDHGEILNADDVKAQLGIGTRGFMWAPDCNYNPIDHLYYFFFPHKIQSKSEGDPEDIWRIFVAASADPASNFKVKGVIDGIPSTIDPCVFLDNDGQPYIYTSGQGGIWAGRLLKSDWTKLDGQMTKQTGLVDVHEAPFAFKKDGLYYLTFSNNKSTDLGGNELVYAISNSPLGPWTYKGVYMHSHGEDTAHGSIVNFKGMWYQFYHTANYSGAGALRSVCFDPVTFAADGSIEIVHNWGSQKAGCVRDASLSGTLKIEAEDFNEGGSHTAWYKRPGTADFSLGNMQETQIDVRTSAGRTYLANMKRKEWARYSFNVTENGRYSIICHMRQNNRTDSKFRVGVDGSWVKANEIAVASGSNTWGDTEVKNVELTAGEHFLSWRSMVGDIDLDYVLITKSVNTIPGVVEAEDFDEGSYSFKRGDLGNAKSYRSDKGVALSSADGVVHISNTNSGDWINYTVNSPGGKFRVNSYVASPSSGQFRIDFDNGQQPSGVMSAPTGDWQAYKAYAVDNVDLPAGVHVMTFRVVTDLNVDRFEFIKTGESTGIAELTSQDQTDNVYFDLKGVRVLSPAHGVYIHKGKKVIYK